ncbi:MAG TPA: glycosyltransferase, partial [Dokdonella sp.]
MRGATLILLAWNRWPMTRRCLDSLLATRPYAAEVIVVDNGSEPDPRASLESTFPGVTVLRLDRNRGFAGGCNAG